MFALSGGRESAGLLYWWVCVKYRSVLYKSVLYKSVLYRFVLYKFVLYRSVLYSVYTTNVLGVFFERCQLATECMERLGPPYWTPGPVWYRCVSYLMNGMVLEMILEVAAPVVVPPPPLLVNARLPRHHAGG